MDIIISGKNFDITPSLRLYTEAKLGKLVHFWHKIIRARVEMEVDKGKHSGFNHRVTITLEIPGPDIRVMKESSDMHAAIDLAMPVLERQVNKIKAKLDKTDWHKLRRAREKFLSWYQSWRNGDK